MTVNDITEYPEIEPVVISDGSRLIDGVYTGDLLSWVMGNCHESNAWITVQTHLNVVAVAALKEISCLIIVQDASIPQETLDKAKEEHIAVFETSMSAYEACVFCHEIGC